MLHRLHTFKYLPSILIGMPLQKEITIPEGVEIRQEGQELVVKGPKGELRRRFVHPSITIALSGQQIVFTATAKREDRRLRTMLGTWTAHTKNMITGVGTGWEAKLRTVYSHFPIRVNVEGNTILIQNFIGEKKPRMAKVSGDVIVKVAKDDIIVTGIDKEEVGQTAANIELTTKVTKRDKRVFQDGCYITQKPVPIGKA